MEADRSWAKLCFNCKFIVNCRKLSELTVDGIKHGHGDVKKAY